MRKEEGGYPERYSLGDLERRWGLGCELTVLY